MFIKNCIKKSTQYNCCLDRKAICMKRSWDEISKMLDTFCDCKKCRKCCKKRPKCKCKH